MGFIPENPLTMATVPFMSVLENMAITRTSNYSRFGGLDMDWQLVQEDTRKSLEKFGFTFSYYTPAKSLSGGNLQRLIIAREMMKDPQLIVASYLTRGLDVQSTIVARQELMNARNEGAGVLLISEDLEELFSLSDRLVVLCDGSIVANSNQRETNFYEIGYLMTGSKELMVQTPESRKKSRIPSNKIIPDGDSLWINDFIGFNIICCHSVDHRKKSNHFVSRPIQGYSWQCLWILRSHCGNDPDPTDGPGSGSSFTDRDDQCRG